MQQASRQNLNADESVVVIKVEMDRLPDVLGSDDTRLDDINRLQADVRSIGVRVVAETKHSMVRHSSRLPDTERLRQFLPLSATTAAYR